MASLTLGQLNLEPTRPNGLVGCKVPTDLVKISVKEATHMGFHYKVPATDDMLDTQSKMASKPARKPGSYWLKYRLVTFAQNYYPKIPTFHQIAFDFV